MIIPSNINPDKPNKSEPPKENLCDVVNCDDFKTEITSVFENPCKILNCNKLVAELLANEQIRSILFAIIGLLAIIVCIMIYNLVKSRKTHRKK